MRTYFVRHSSAFGTEKLFQIELVFSLLAPVIRKKRKSIWNMLVEKQDIKTLRNLDENSNENLTLLNRNPPQSGFSLQLLTIET